MYPPIHPSRSRRTIHLRRPVCAAIAGVVALVTILTLTGWILGIEGLTRLRADLPQMSPFCALSLFFAAISIWLLRIRVRARIRVARILSCTILTIGVLRLVEYVAGTENGFDTLWQGAGSGMPLKHMAPNSAALFILLALGILLTDVRSRDGRIAREICILGVLMVGSLGLIGYLYEANGLYQFPAFTPMSLQTASCAFLLAVGLGLARPSRGIVGVALSPRLGGWLLRRLLPAAVVVVVALAWICSTCEQRGVLPYGFADAFLAGAASVIIGSFIWTHALYLNRVDQEQVDTKRELHAAQAELERLLDRRTDELRASQRELRDTGALFEAVLQQMPAGVMVADAPTGRIVLTNQRASTVLREVPAEAASIEGYTVYKGFHPDGSPVLPHEWPLARSLTSAESIREEEIDYLFGDGQRGTLLLNSGPVLDPGGKVVAAVVTFTDITAQKAARSEQAARAEMQQELDAARSTKTAMQEALGVVAHELRTPLSCVRLFVDALLAAPAFDAKTIVPRLRSLEAVALSMGETLDSILEAARADAGRLTWNWETVDVRAVCTDARVTLEALARERQVTLRVRVYEGAHRFRGDAGALRRLIVNLVSNACKHSGGRSVSLDLRRETEDGRPFLAVTVRDSGEGMSSDVLARLGDPFALGRDGFTPGRSFGSGLGLSICRVIAAAHGGWIGVSSERGKGTTVEARLAADLDAPVEASGPPPAMRILGASPATQAIPPLAA